ncbi:MAG: phosphopantetheine-binding protein [Leptothrix sp. (in: Bacteria)]|nr:phosphopantetheine-binding protein [Leptothrix sp. (in: b-proteobacteria)]
MKTQAIRSGVLQTLQRIAPEVDPTTLAAGEPLRNQVDLDSMDWLNVRVGLHQRFGVDNPEADPARLVTLDGVVAYLAERVG